MSLLVQVLYLVVLEKFSKELVHCLFTRSVVLLDLRARLVLLYATKDLTHGLFYLLIVVNRVIYSSGFDL